MPITLLVFLRGAISFVTLFIMARALGKQQLKQLTFFEYITGITVGSMAAALTVDLNTRGWVPFVGLLTWTGLTAGVQHLALRNRRIGQCLSGQPVLLIKDGRILEQNMRAQRYRFEDLFTQLRQQGVHDIGEVTCAILETSGDLTVIRRSDRQRPAVLLVQEGELLHENLPRAGVDAEWVDRTLRLKGIQSLEEVTVAMLVGEGELYVDTYDDGPA